jgi:hypothetical protein
MKEHLKRVRWAIVGLISSFLVFHISSFASAQTVPVTGEADVSSITQEIDELRSAIGDLTARVDALQSSDPTPQPPTPTPPPTSGGKSTDLWLNVSHYRYTPVLAYKDGAYVVTDPRFVELMSKWSGIRYLNWTGQLNRDVNWSWANRVTQADADRWDSVGVPLEAIIAVANATHTHVWWCAPQQADLDYMKQAGRLFAETLDPDLHVVIEIGNEVWQSSRGWRYDELSGGVFGTRMRLYAEDSAAKFKAFVNGVGGVGFPRERLTRVIGGQLHNIGVLKSNALQHINPGDYDAISCSGYFGNAPGNWISGSGGLNASLAGLRAHAELAGQYQKQLLIYELNQHIDTGTDNTEYIDRDDVIAGVKTMIDNARGLGIKTIAVYSGPGRSYKNAPWPIYTPSYTPRKIVTELGWPTLD